MTTKTVPITKNVEIKKKKVVKVLKCPRCESEHIVKHQSVVTVTKGKRQRVRCQSCGHTFYNEEKE